MHVEKLDYKMPKFNQESVEALLTNLRFDTNNYFFTMTKASVLSRMLIGNMVDFFANRYCMFAFTETEINLIMFSRLDTRKVTEIIRVNKNEINNIKLSNVLISYMLDMKYADSNMKFQVFKKFGNFTKTKSAIELFRKLYLNV